MEKITRILAVVEHRENGALILEKAVALARRFGARVDLMLADFTLTSDLTALCRVMKYAEVILSSVHRGQATMQELILRRALETRPDLVVKEPAGAHPTHRWTLDESDLQLANECPAPVLIVRHRLWANPVRFAAAVDVSDRDTAALARSILHAAGFLAMGVHGNLDILYSEREQHDEAVRLERAVSLAQLVREYHVGCERIQVFSGDPGKVLPPLLTARQYDVLVIGAESRRTGLHAVGGGTISRLVEAHESDVVLVRSAAPDIVEYGADKASGREQRSDHLEHLV